MRDENLSYSCLRYLLPFASTQRMGFSRMMGMLTARLMLTNSPMVGFVFEDDFVVGWGESDDRDHCLLELLNNVWLLFCWICCPELVCCAAVPTRVEVCWFSVLRGC